MCLDFDVDTNRARTQKSEDLGLPVDVLQLVSPWPQVAPTQQQVRVAELAKGKPLVLHLYTA